jgi:serine/threonine-protein kinase TNNI3K
MSANASAAGSASASGTCSADLINAFQYSFTECSRATGINTLLGIVQPTSDEQRKLLCSNAMCSDLFRLFRNNANEHCAVGSLVELNPDSVAQVLAVCTTPAPTVSPRPTNSSAVPTPSSTPTPTTVVNKTSSGSHTGAIAGGVGGGIAALVLLCLLVIWWRRSRRGKNASDDDTRGGGSAVKQSDVYTTMPLTPKTEPSDSGPWSDPAITAVRIPLEKIKLGALLSQGAYGEVYRATYNDQQVAVKKVLPARRRELAQIHSFLDEIKLTASLEHSCIVKFIGVAWDSLSDLCMVTEFMPGGDLRMLLQQYARDERPLGFDYDKLQIAVQVAHALTYLHSLQPVVVHRDLKSRNILLTAQLDAKLIDFGVSRERKDLTMTAGVGTSLWMAPEVMLGERYDEKADIFSFGVVLSELDTHGIPYSQVRASTGSERKMADMVLMQMISQGEISVQFSDVADPTIVALARDCLQLDPAARPTSAELLHRIHTAWRTSSAQ